MIKSWYTHVRDETMAPARMVSFMEQHISSCDTCREDTDLKGEIAKITEMILPESKIPKAIRQPENDDIDEIDLDTSGEVADEVDGDLDDELDEEVDQGLDDEIGDEDPALDKEV